MNWISKQNAQRKANLLKYNPVVDHASKGPEQRGKKLQKKILNLSEKHKGLHDAVIEGHGQNKYTTGDYDVDRQKLYKVDEKLENKLSKWKKRFGEDFSQWDNSPSMEGPLNKQKRFDKTVSKAEAAYDEGNYKKAYRKGKSVARQAKRHGVMSSEEAKSFKQDMKSSLGMDMQGPLNKGCAKSDGGPGCVQKRGGEYVIINNKKPGNQIWRSGFSSRKAANDNLAAYHTNK